MSKMNKIIMFFNHFSLGLVVPVLNLILLDKGATLQTLPLLYGVMAVTVLCFELPSGILADLIGRKKVFLISCIFNLLSFLLLLFSNHIILLIGIIVIYGLGRAFASGSLDALIIDQTLELHGKEYLPRITSTLAILEGIGLSLGSICGGIVAQVSGTYDSNLLLRIFLIFVVLLLAVVAVKESNITTERKEKVSLIEHLKEGKMIVFSNRILASVILGVFFVGTFLTTIETYWQSAFIALTSKQNSNWLLGIITFMGFLAVTLGNTLSQKILNKLKEHHMNIYLISRGLLAISIVIFAIQKKSITFIAGYIGVYLLLGISNVSESTLMNHHTPNHMRASVLSLYSFTTQVGVMAGSILSTLFITKIQFNGIWILMASFLMGYTIIISFLQGMKRNSGKFKSC